MATPGDDRGRELARALDDLGRLVERIDTGTTTIDVSFATRLARARLDVARYVAAPAETEAVVHDPTTEDEDGRCTEYPDLIDRHGARWVWAIGSEYRARHVLGGWKCRDGAYIRRVFGPVTEVPATAPAPEGEAGDVGLCGEPLEWDGVDTILARCELPAETTDGRCAGHAYSAATPPTPETEAGDPPEAGPATLYDAVLSALNVLADDLPGEPPVILAWDPATLAGRVTDLVEKSGLLAAPAETEAGDDDLAELIGELRDDSENLGTLALNAEGEHNYHDAMLLRGIGMDVDRAVARRAATPPAPEGEAVYREPPPGEPRPPRVHWSRSMCGPGRSGLYVDLPGRGGLVVEESSTLHVAQQLPDDVVDLVPGVRTPAPAGPQAEGAGGQSIRDRLAGAEGLTGDEQLAVSADAARCTPGGDD